MPQVGGHGQTGQDRAAVVAALRAQRDRGDGVRRDPARAPQASFGGAKALALTSIDGPIALLARRG